MLPVIKDNLNLLAKSSLELLEREEERIMQEHPELSPEEVHQIAVECICE